MVLRIATRMSPTVISAVSMGFERIAGFVLVCAQLLPDGHEIVNQPLELFLLRHVCFGDVAEYIGRGHGNWPVAWSTPADQLTADS